MEGAILRPCKTYFKMLSNYKAHKTKNNRLTFCNEGGARAAKTFDAFFLILDFIRVSPRALKCRAYRNTLLLCKQHTFADFAEVLKLRGGIDGAQIFAPNLSPRVTFPNGSEILFLGLDSATSCEGGKSDIVFINEVLSGVTEDQYKNTTMRCEMLVILDWNPKFTQHWVFGLEGRPDVFFTHSTYKDNPHLNPATRSTIESYEPTPSNIAKGTADEWRWKVYGQGVRAAQEGAIFRNITWIDEFPADRFEYVTYGLDFGYTNDPTALVRIGFEAPNNLYLEECLYTPIADASTLCDVVHPIIGDDMCWADSADKYVKTGESMILALQSRGASVAPVVKSRDSLEGGIAILKSCNLYIVKSRNFENEANNYTWARVNGITINKPNDEFNHLWDAVRYAVISQFKFEIDY